MNSVVEYHNRLEEYIRLAERKLPPAVIAEHAEGVNTWRKFAETDGLGFEKSSVHRWASEYFHDIPVLEERARALGLDLRRTKRW